MNGCKASLTFSKLDFIIFIFDYLKIYINYYHFNNINKNANCSWFKLSINLFPPSEYIEITI